MEAFNRLHTFLAETAFPARWDRVGGARPAVETLGLFGLALMALSLGIGNTGQSVGMGLLLIASLCAWRALWAGLKKDWVARAVLAGFGLVSLRTLWAIWEMPELTMMHLDQVREMLRVLLFPLACWWLGGERRSVLSVCILVLAGAVTDIVYYGDWAEVDLFALSQRLWFGGDPRMEGLLYVSILAGMIAFAPSWWGRHTDGLQFFARVTIWLALYLLILWALIAVQARAAWIAGTVVGLLFFAWFVGRALRLHKSGSTKHSLAAALALLIGTGVLLATFADTIGNRMLEARELYELLVRGDVEEVENLSIAGRAYVLSVGWNAWLQRPIVGWGPGIGQYLIPRADIPQAYQGSFELHNNYLDVLMQFGVIGALLFFGFWFRLIARFTAWVQTRRISVDMGGFVLSVSVVFFIVNLTDSYIDTQFGWFYMIILCALLHSPLMQPAAVSRDGGSTRFS